jgi:dienelactone hydrolase
MLVHEPLDPALVQLQSEGLTVEHSFVLDAYTLAHERDYRSFRVVAPDADGEEITAHLVLPPGEGPHPAILVFPILAGSHVASEALAKAFVDRRYAVLRLERRPLHMERQESADYLAERVSGAVRASRRLLDWLVTHPEIDPERIGVAGISFGSFLAAVLLGVDERPKAGFLALTGGGLGEILHDSREKPVRVFRDRLMSQYGLESREAFLEFVEPYVYPMDPLTYAGNVEPGQVLMVTARFDRIVPPERARALWDALGEPTWVKVPTGHYQALPLLWYAAARGADHFDRQLGRPSDPAE